MEEYDYILNFPVAKTDMANINGIEMIGRLIKDIGTTQNQVEHGVDGARIDQKGFIDRDADIFVTIVAKEGTMHDTVTFLGILIKI